MESNFLTQRDSAELLNLARLAAGRSSLFCETFSSSAAKMRLRTRDRRQLALRRGKRSVRGICNAFGGFLKRAATGLSSARRSFPCRRESPHAIKWARNGANLFAHSDHCDLFSAPRANVDVVASSITVS